MDQYNKGLVLAKIETIYGTDSTPAVDTNALITKGMPTLEIIGNPRQREVPLAHFGQIAPVNVGEGIKLSFTTELKHSGTAATPSRYGCLFRACNMTEAVTSSVAYTPNSTMEGESVTLWFYANTTLHKILGCVGTFQIKLVSQEIVTVEWTFTGLYAGAGHASTVSFPAATHEAIAPVIWKGASFVYNSVSSLRIPELTFDMGNEVAKRLSGNAVTGIDRYFVKNRMAKGNMIIEKVALATLDPWTLYNAATQANIAAVSGATSGNICTFAVTGVTLEPPKYSDKENIQMWDLAFSLNPTVGTGNNEIVLTFS